MIASGIDIAYPPQHAALQERIASEGLLLAEQPPGTEPRGSHFPSRNRIIAGLALGTLVVEAAPKSGSLITARLAGEAGREVMAIPGSPLDARSHGCNQLIREGAVLVQAPEDVIELLSGFDGTPRSTLREAQPHRFGGDDELLADEPADIAALLTTAPIGVDELVRQSGTSAGAVQMALLELEIAGRLVRHAGGRVSLTNEGKGMQNEASFTGIFGELSSSLGSAWRRGRGLHARRWRTDRDGVYDGAGGAGNRNFDFGFDLNTDNDPLGALFEIVTGIATLVANYFLLKRYLASKGRMRADGNRFWPYFGMAISRRWGSCSECSCSSSRASSSWSAVGRVGVRDRCRPRSYRVALTSSWNATKGYGWAIFFAGTHAVHRRHVLAGLIGGVLGVASMSTVNVIVPFLQAGSNRFLGVRDRDLFPNPRRHPGTQRSLRLTDPS